MRKYCLRHWRGNGQVIADIVKDSYMDYPKNSMNKNARRIGLAECIVQIITEEEYLKDILQRFGVKEHNRRVKNIGLGSWKLIKE